MKQEKKKIKKKFQNSRLKKTEFFKIANSQICIVKILWIGPLVSRIDWCEGHWCSSTYIVVQKQPKNTKNAFFACFWAYVQQPQNHIGWATSMTFASISSTNPRTNQLNFQKKILRIGDFEKLSFFQSSILDFFFKTNIFFFFIPMKISHKLCVRMDGTQFWCFSWFPANTLLCVILRYTVYILETIHKFNFFLLRLAMKWLHGH